MKTWNRALGALVAFFAFGIAGQPALAADHPYTEGQVMAVSAVRTEPGMYETYKNMAALDGLSDRMEVVQEKLLGDQVTRDKLAVERTKMRTQLGTELMREVILK